MDNSKFMVDPSGCSWTFQVSLLEFQPFLFPLQWNWVQPPVRAGAKLLHYHLREVRISFVNRLDASLL